MARQEAELEEAIRKLEKEMERYQQSVIDQTALDEQKKDISVGFERLNEESNEITREKEKVKELFKKIAEDQNQLTIFSKNLKAKEAKLNRREQEIKKAEALIAKEKTDA